MNEPTIKQISAELSNHLDGQKFGKIFALSKLQIAIDFRTSDGKYLFISASPNSPRIYLIERNLKQLEKQSKLQLPFVSFLRKRLANAILQKIEKAPNERVLKFFLTARSELGKTQLFTLVVQLTGRSSNIFLLDENHIVLDSLRETFGIGQRSSDEYVIPERSSLQKPQNEQTFKVGNFKSFSEALDGFYLKREEDQCFESLANSAKANLNKTLKKKKTLLKKLTQDLVNHGDSKKWKKLGDLLLANIATAERNGDKVTVIDYFDESTPQIEIKIDENLNLTEAAEKFFKRYTKARNAKIELSKRLEALDIEIKTIEAKIIKLETAISEKDENIVSRYSGKKDKKPKQKTKKRPEDSFTGAKRFVSSDGMNILVGKRSKDNDYLTFRVAKSLDLWLHAADYPGSHVIIKNPNRTEISQQTLLEAAQLAAFYSKAKNELKAAVHYTQKKFVNKPKGAQAGLVSLASFKTIVVKPKFLKQKNDE